MSCLVELADTVDAETRLHAVGALCNLSVAAGNRSQMISQRAAIALNLSKCANQVLNPLPLCVHPVRSRVASRCVQETMRRCALALVNLSSELELQSEFVAQGALVGLLQLCTEGSPLIKVLCARALYNLSFDPFSREALVKANVRQWTHVCVLLEGFPMLSFCPQALPSLVTLSFSDHEYTVGLCSITFFNLAGQASCQAAVRALPLFLRLSRVTHPRLGLCVCAHAGVRRGGCLASNLTHHGDLSHPGCCARIVLLPRVPRYLQAVSRQPFRIRVQGSCSNACFVCLYPPLRALGR